jgi:hypothetical protein
MQSTGENGETALTAGAALGQPRGRIPRARHMALAKRLRQSEATAKAAPQPPETCGHRLRQPASPCESAGRDSGPAATASPHASAQRRGACRVSVLVVEGIAPIDRVLLSECLSADETTRGMKARARERRQGSVIAARHSGMSAECSQPHSRLCCVNRCRSSRWRKRRRRGYGRHSDGPGREDRETAGGGRRRQGIVSAESALRRRPTSVRSMAQCDRGFP